MKYDFVKEFDRTHQYSEKWNVAKNELPLSLGDMDFPSAPCVLDSLARVVKQGIFGYTHVPDTWKDAYIHWWKLRHGVALKRENLLFSEGVIPAISAALRRFAAPGEKVLVMTPGYHIFFRCIESNGLFVTESPLNYSEGKYSINWEDLEEKMSDPKVRVMLLCNPQNPTGSIWRREELVRIGELAAHYHLKVISDEIHCDILDPGYSYTPFHSASRVCARVGITLLSPSKTFNLSGIHSAAVYVTEPALRNRMMTALETDGLSDPGSFAIDAVIAAYNKGSEWVDELCKQLADNKKTVRERLAAELPKVRVVYSHATYLMWLDCSAITQDSACLCSLIREKTGLVLNAGEDFGEHGRGFLRMNIATQPGRLNDGISRLVEALKDM